MRELKIGDIVARIMFPKRNIDGTENIFKCEVVEVSDSVVTIRDLSTGEITSAPKQLANSILGFPLWDEYQDSRK